MKNLKEHEEESYRRIGCPGALKLKERASEDS